MRAGQRVSDGSSTSAGRREWPIVASCGQLWPVVASGFLTEAVRARDGGSGQLWPVVRKTACGALASIGRRLLPEPGLARARLPQA
eukprot:1182357-Prorocentrum_minimum.AAC.1